MNLLKKVTAALSAVVMAAGAVSAIPTCAIGINPPDSSQTSAFQYELETYRLSDTRIGVRFQVTTNPGCDRFAFALKYGSECTFQSATPESADFTGKFGFSDETHTFVYSLMSQNIDRDGKVLDSTGKYSCFIEFDIPSDAAYPLQFSSSVIRYKSNTEKIDFTYTGNNGEYPVTDSTIGVKLKDVPYRIGDVDGDNKITMDDGFDILQIARYGKNNLSVDDLNEYIIKRSYCQGARKAWSEAFPKLTYAECADANQDGSIKSEDSDEVMEYVSQAAASNITMSTLVNSIGYKKVTYEY